MLRPFRNHWLEAARLQWKRAFSRLSGVVANREGQVLAGVKPHPVAVSLTKDEVKILERISRHYERSMGVFRFAVQLSARGDTRDRYRFMTDEGRVLRQMTRAALADMVRNGESERDVDLMPISLIAFWGRLLSSLLSTHSRRKLAAGEIERREALGRKLEGGAALLWKRQRRAVEEALETRRATEAGWMREKLAGKSGAIDS